MGLAGVEECSDPVIAEVSKSEADAFDEVIEGLGGSVGDPCEVVVADLVEPGANGASELLDLGGMAFFKQVLLSLFEHGANGVDVGELVEVTQSLLDHVGHHDFTVGIAQFERGHQAIPGVLTQLLFCRQQSATDLVERVVLAAPVPLLLVLDATPHVVDTAVGQLDTVSRKQ